MPAAGLVWLAASTPPPLTAAAPLLGVGVMGAGMIGAAAACRFGTGVAMALLAGLGLALLGAGLGMAGAPARLPSTMLAIAIAGISFAARGALFARSAAPRGWWVAVAVVAGEGAMLAVATLRPEVLPDVLLALLPAQWASAAIGTALSSAGLALTELAALAGTAAATGLVIRLWPRRWTYLVMFSAWIGLSLLVWLYPTPPFS